MRCVDKRTAFLTVMLGFGMGCGGEADNDSGANETGDETSASDDASSGAEDSSGSDAGSGDASSGDGDSSGDADTGDGDSSDSSDTGNLPGGPENLPEVSGTCPSFDAGVRSFGAAGIDARNATVWANPGLAGSGGALVLYWHGTGSNPNEAAYGLSQAVVDDIVAGGGVVVAPSSSPASGQFPWFLIGGFGNDEDMVLADEIVACAIQEMGIDPSRIHSTGMSAGGLQTTQLSGYRSNYMASVASYSGGSFATVMKQDPSNKFAAMIIHGGANDVYGGMVNFMDTSTAWFNQLLGNGQFAFMCDHGGGHTIPAGVGDDIWQFFQDHPYGTDPSPYEGGLPAGFPSYCALP